MSVQRSAEWRKERHEMLDEHIKQFRVNSHRLLDRILAEPYIQDDDFIMQEESLQVLPQTVMYIMCFKCKTGPSGLQKEWKAELEKLKKVLK